jgi:hypothetical protein
VSQISSSSNGAFFPDTDGLTSEALTAALTESSEIKPYDLIYFYSTFEFKTKRSFNKIEYLFIYLLF